MSKARDIADLDFNSPDIDGGNIDGATIGGTTPAAGSFSGLKATGFGIQANSNTPQGFQLGGTETSSTHIGNIRNVGGKLAVESAVGRSITLRSFASNSTTYDTLTCDTSQNVSIPNGNLDVNGDGTFKNTTDATGATIKVADSSNRAITITSPISASSAAGRIAVTGTVNSLEIGVRDYPTTLKIEGSSGKVLLSNSLTVSKTSSGNLMQIASLVNPVGTANTGVRLWMSGTDTTSRGTFIDAVAESTSNNHTLRFGTSATASTPVERMRITSTGGITHTSVAGGHVRFNSGVIDSDFTVSSDGYSHMLHVDGANNQVNIGTAANMGGLLNVRRNTANSFTGYFENLNASGYGQGWNSVSGHQVFMYHGGAHVGNISTASNYIKYSTGSSADLRLQAGGTREVVVNDDGADTNFRVESDSNANMLFVDGGNNRVGVATSSPAAPLDVGFGDNSNIFRASYASGEDNFFLELDSKIITGGVVGYQFHTKNNGTDYNNNLTLDRGKVGIGCDAPAKPLEVRSNDFQLRLATASGPSSYYTQFISAYDSTNPFRIQGHYNGTTVEFLKISAAGGFSGPILKLGQGMSYTSLYTGTTERISLQPTQGSIYENIHANVTGNFDLSFVRGQKFARAGSIANEVKSRIFLGSYTYSGGTIDYVITKNAGSQVHVGSGTINWFARESAVHHTITGTNDSSQIVVNGNQYTTAGAAGKFTISIRATNGDSHLTIQNRLGSTCHIGLRINVNYVG